MPLDANVYHPSIVSLWCFRERPLVYLAYTSDTHRKPMLVVLLSGVFDVRAATR